MQERRGIECPRGIGSHDEVAKGIGVSRETVRNANEKRYGYEEVRSERVKTAAVMDG